MNIHKLNSGKVTNLCMDGDESPKPLQVLAVAVKGREHSFHGIYVQLWNLETHVDCAGSHVCLAKVLL